MDRWMYEWIDGWMNGYAKKTGRIVLLSSPRSYQGGTSLAGFSLEVTWNGYQILKPLMKLVPQTVSFLPQNSKPSGSTHMPWHIHTYTHTHTHTR